MIEILILTIIFLVIATSVPLHHLLSNSIEDLRSLFLILLICQENLVPPLKVQVYSH